MDKLEKCYEEFEIIKAKYNGKETDWKMMYYLIDKLYTHLRCIKIKSQKNYSFLIWVKDKLEKEIKAEKDRIKEFVD